MSEYVSTVRTSAARNIGTSVSNISTVKKNTSILLFVFLKKKDIIYLYVLYFPKKNPKLK
jgi:hypothetical protein